MRLVHLGTPATAVRPAPISLKCRVRTLTFGVALMFWIAQGWAEPPGAAGPGFGQMQPGSSELAVEPHAKPALSLKFTEGTLQVSGISRGGGAVFFGVAHVPGEYTYRITPVVEVVGDSDGTAGYRPPFPISGASTWCVVDRRTGAWTAASPWGAVRDAGSGRASRPSRGGEGTLSMLEHRIEWLELLLVRPGGDVWRLAAGKGGFADDDKTGGPTYRSAVDRFQPVTSGARPIHQLTPADLILGINPRTLEFFAVEVNQ